MNRTNVIIHISFFFHKLSKNVLGTRVGAHFMVTGLNVAIKIISKAQFSYGNLPTSIDSRFFIIKETKIITIGTE